MSEGRHAEGEQRRRRRNAIVVTAIVVGLPVFVVGYVLGANGGESAASRSPTVSSSAASARSMVSRSPAASASSTPEAAGDELADGKYFVQLNDLRGGEDGPLLIRYDLAYFYTGGQANQIAASRGDETPVPDDTYIVNDNPKLRFAPLAEDFTVRYIPEGSGSAKTVAAPQDRFIAWLHQTEQTDFQPKDITYWRITIDGGKVTTIEQQYLP